MIEKNNTIHFLSFHFTYHTSLSFHFHWSIRVFTYEILSSANIPLIPLLEGITFYLSHPPKDQRVYSSRSFVPF